MEKQLEKGMRYLVSAIIKNGHSVVVGYRGVEEIKVIAETDHAYQIRTEDSQVHWVLKTDRVDVVDQLTYGDPIPVYISELNSNKCSHGDDLQCDNCKPNCGCGPNEGCSDCVEVKEPYQGDVKCDCEGLLHSECRRSVKETYQGHVKCDCDGIKHNLTCPLF